MSILETEPHIFPEDLLDGLIDQASERKWWVLRTRSRQEKAIARDLSRWQVPYYLPLVEERKAVRGRSRRCVLPMFAGYLFLYGDEEERVASLKTNRVAQVLAVQDQQRLTHDLRQVERLTASGAALCVESKLTPGRRVIVTGGSLAGLEGVILTRRGVNRLFVSVDLIQQGVSLEVDDFMVAPLE